MEMFMDKTTAFYNFDGVYELADMVQDCVRDGFYLEDIGFGWKDKGARLALAKPQRLSLLHHYIYHVIRIVRCRQYRTNGGDYDENDAKLIETRFKEYGLKITPFLQFCEKSQDIDASGRWWA